MQFTDVCMLNQVGAGATRSLRAGGQDIALPKAGSTVHAIENACLRAGAPA